MFKPETKNIEYKIDLNKDEWKKWLKTFCGYANSKGGEILFGYNDRGEFVGISKEKIDGYVRHINQIVRNHSRPPLKFDVTYKSEKEGLVAICIYVAERRECLNWLVENNHMPELYVRYEGETQLATLEEMQDLLIATNKYDYDSIVVGNPMNNVKFDELNEVYSKNNMNERLTPKMLKSFNLLTNSNELTLAGYLFCDDTDYVDSNITCNTWPNVTKGSREIDDYKNYNGSIMYLIDSAIKYIQNVSYYSFGGIKKDLYINDNSSFSILSLREAIVNAFAHRDYQIKGNDIQVNCFPDRIEITSPGKSLVSGNSSECKKLESFPSHRRNKTICNVLSKCKLMEEKGSGFEAILDDYSGFTEEYQPLYKSDRVSFTIILKNKKYKLKGTTLKTTIKDYPDNAMMFKSRVEIYEQNEKIEYIEKIIQDDQKNNLDDIAKKLGMTRDGAKYYIGKMKNACLIKRVGSSKNGHYELINDLDRPADFENLPIDIKNKVVEWCKRNFISTSEYNENHTSYGLKHIYEKVEGVYLTNGQFKGAMLLAGFKCKFFDQPNWHFNISKESSALNLDK